MENKEVTAPGEGVNARVSEKKRIVVACGGTGGHAFPGLAVAKELLSRGHDVAVWDSGRMVESDVMRSWEGGTFSTGARQLSVKNLFANLFALLRCRREIKRFRPHALLAMGSYSSLPPVLAARSAGVPIVLHEANTVPGRAVDTLSRFTKTVAVSFAVTKEHLPGRATELTGLPVREGIEKGERFAEVPSDAFCVFVTGGSQGAHRVNELVTAAMPLVKAALDRTGRKLYVIHQTGLKDEGPVMGRYAAAGISSRVNAFEHEMARAFASADLVIARAGASTCFELARAGKPAFLIPLPSALRNHQHFNAEAFVAAGAADEGKQDEITPRAIANYILNKIEHPHLLMKMAECMRAMSVPDAAGRVADLVEQNSLP